MGFASASLPPVSGKSIIPKTDRPKSSSAVICKHVSDLKCANCIQDHPKKLSLRLDSFSRTSEADSSGCHRPSSVDPDLSIGLKRYPSPTDLRGGKGEKHWTSSFVKTPVDRRRQSRHVAGRYPFSAGTTPRQLGDMVQNVDQKMSSGDFRPARDSLQLQVTGGTTGGNINCGVESNETDRLAPGSARSDRGVRGYRVTNVQNLTSFRKPSTAQPLRHKAGQLDASRDSYNLDKTQQILSWLADVKLKDGYRPRHARLYALETQQTH